MASLLMEYRALYLSVMSTLFEMGGRCVAPVSSGKELIAI